MKKIEFLVLKIGQFERTSKNAHISKRTYFRMYRINLGFFTTSKSASRISTSLKFQNRHMPNDRLMELSSFVLEEEFP